jgi:hypothetical protein
LPCQFGEILQRSAEAGNVELEPRVEERTAPTEVVSNATEPDASSARLHFRPSPL